MKCTRQRRSGTNAAAIYRYGYGCLEPSLADLATRKSQGRLCHTKYRIRTGD